jgi:hypothetical protein
VSAFLGVVKTKGEFSKVVRVHEAAFARPFSVRYQLKSGISDSFNLGARFRRMNPIIVLMLR